MLRHEIQEQAPTDAHWLVARHRQDGREEGRSEQANTIRLVISDVHMLFAASMCTKDVATTVEFRTDSVFL